MNAHLCLKRTKITAALLLALPISLVATQIQAKEPVFLNTAKQLDSLVTAGKIITKDVNDADVITLGVSSSDAAVQQAIILDGNNLAYSAYMSLEDNKAYVMKLVDDAWVSANPADAAGVVSAGELLAKEQTTYAIKQNASLALAVSSANEPYLAYLDTSGDVVIEKLTFDEQGSPVAWQQVAKTNGAAAHFLRFKLDSNNNPYVLYGAGDSGTADVVLVKYDVADGAWSTVGDRAITSVKAKNNVAHAAFALNSSDVPYLAFNNGTLGLDANKIYVQKLDAGVWSTVGSRKIATNQGVGSGVRSLDFTVSKNDVPYVLAESWVTRLSVAKFTAESNDGDWQIIGGHKINVPFQTNSNFSSIPPDITISVDAEGVPYIAYQDNNSRDSLPQSRMRVLRLETLLIDDVLTDVWQQMDIGDDIIIPTNVYAHRYNHVVFDSYNRPYVTYQNVGGTDKTNVLRADVENNTTDAITFTLDEKSDVTKYNGGIGRFDVETDSPVTLELIDYDDVQDDLKTASLFEIDPVSYELSLKFIDDGRYSNGEDDIVANDGINDHVGHFETPSYSFKVKATNASGASEEIPVKVNFQEVEAYESSRGFAFKVFPTCPETGCAININENETVPFEAIKSKISHFEITSGTLPDGITGFDASGFITEIDVDGEVEIQPGKVSYISGGTTQAENEVSDYPLTITAFPNDSAAGSDPISLNVVLTVNDIEMNVVFNGELDAENPDAPVLPLTPAQAYSRTLNEQIEYSVTPDVAIAVSKFTIDNHPTWLQFDGLSGELMGTPDFEEAGEYSGIITAHGFDGELVDYPYAITVNHVPLNLTPVFVDDVFQDAYLSTHVDDKDDLNTNNVNENLEISIARITTINENRLYKFTLISEAAKSFSIEGVPSWAVFDPETGEVSGRPSYTDEGEYSFTITGYGFDDEARQSISVDLTVEHANAPPSIEHIANFTTEENKAITVNLMDYVPALDVDGDTVFLVPDSVVIVADSDGEVGVGELTQTQNGFIYTPATGDMPLVLFEFAVSDSNGAIYYVENTTLPRVGINVEAYESQSVEQTSTGGSFGGGILAFFGLIFGARLYKRKAQ